MFLSKYDSPIKISNKVLYSIDEVFNSLRSVVKEKEANINAPNWYKICSYWHKIPISSLEEFEDLVSKYENGEISHDEIREILSKDYDFYTFPKFNDMLKLDNDDLFYYKMEIKSNIMVGDEEFFVIGYISRD